MDRYTVIFQPEGAKVEVAAGKTLLDAAAEAGVYLTSLCGGEGVCGKCRVQILRGRVKPATSSIPFFSPDEIREGFVLACATKIDQELEVWVPPEARLEEQQILTAESPVCYGSPVTMNNIRDDLETRSLLHMPLTTRLFLSLPEPTLTDNLSDLARIYREIRKHIPAPHLETSLSTLRGLAALLRESNWKVTATLHSPEEHCVEVRAIDPGDTCAENYGIACDIGTTTIVTQLVDLQSGAVLGVEASHNQQAKYGEDVISRMIFACSRGGMSPIHRAVMDTVNSLIDTLLDKHRVEPSRVTAMCAAGNPTMTHLFLGLEPCTIRLEPYVPTVNFPPTASGAELDLHLHPRAVVVCMPGTASYVGGDITAGVLASGMSNRPEVSALIDIGTNGEIVIGNNEWLVCCSASAGPAFEGAGTRCGMRATHGAIQKATIDGDRVQYETIGGIAPRGICGSGLIDTIAELFRNRIIDPNGKFFQTRDKPRVREGEEGWEFVLAADGETETGKGIVITETDIGNLVKSKGAILAAMRVLLKSVGLSFGDLEQIFVAGGFGNYLNLEKAIFIGLLPDVPLDKIRFIGNSSLTGARMALLSRHAYDRACTLARQMTYFELSVSPDFMDEFVAALFIPHTDMDLFPSVREVMGK
jgi:uncharacterized 2Fe-2S/4Fe-4S cluster protein (DUF4445 family)